MNNALVAKDAEQSRAEFQKVLQTCMACHIAEKVGFLNESPVFKRLATFPPLAK
jgi:cytochrome c553